LFFVVVVFVLPSFLTAGRVIEVVLSL